MHLVSLCPIVKLGDEKILTINQALGSNNDESHVGQHVELLTECCYYTRSTDEETEAQTYSGAESRWLVMYIDIGRPFIWRLRR